MNEIKVTNMTSLFRKDMLLYSFFDIRLKSPVRVVAVLYFFLLLIITGTLALLFRLPFNVYTLMVVVGIPFGGAMIMSKPQSFFDGKNFASWAKTQYRYYNRPKELFDWESKPKETRYKVNSIITISRHDDYNELYKIKKSEMEGVSNV